ncbi:MAG TPA: thioredoxin-disulfide reductase [Bacteroidales bacterium]|nr:thioredoxin-disulfide reductase [Bacteroidales bacterium]
MKEITSAEFEKEVLQKIGIVVVDFYSTECPPCEALAPKFDALSELYKGHAEFVKIFRQGNKELAASLGVSGSPTVLFFQDGKQIGDVLSGGIKRAAIEKNLNALLPEQIVASIASKIVPAEQRCDVLIIGGGPSGLAAGIYLAQAKIDTLIVDSGMPGGQVSTTHLVSNYPGFAEPVNGYMLTHYMTEQCKNAGVRFKPAVDITDINLKEKKIIVDGFETIHAKKIIIATGASPRYLNVPGEKELKGKGISYCATCDAKYFQDKEVIVIGGGNSAVEESEFISKFASKITVIQNLEKLTANKEACDKLLGNPKVSAFYNSEPRSFEKTGDRIKVKVEDVRKKEFITYEADGAFVFVGMKPNTDMIKDELEKDKWGYIKTDEDMHTSIQDVFAIGDLISKKYRQITTAVNDGTIAAIVAAKELE